MSTRLTKEEDIKRMVVKRMSSLISANNKDGLMIYIPRAIREALGLEKGMRMLFDIKTGNKVTFRKLTKEESELLESK